MTTVEQGRIRVEASLDPTVDQRWADLVATGDGSLFVSPPWLRAIATTYGFEIEARLMSDGATEVGMVFCPLDDAMGRRIVSTPFCDFCDPVLTGLGADASPLVAGLHDPGRPLKMRVKDAVIDPAATGLSIVGTDFWHGVDLVREEEQMWSSLGSTARRNIRKARDAAVTVSFDTSTAAVDAFFAMHQRNRRAKHRLLAQPRGFFHAIHREFAADDAVAVALAAKDGEPIAGIFLLQWMGTTYYKFNASTPEALAARPNDLLMWETMRWARDRGSQLLDLGLSDADQDGLVRYKRKYATDEGRVTTLVGGPARTPQSAELGPVLGQLTELLCDDRVPLDVAERAGDALYRYFT
jgi:CelD/BcsL family acetyltransferase involved in cellulose biosynthesis